MYIESMKIGGAFGTIFTRVREACAVAKEYDCDVEFDFNGQSITVNQYTHALTEHDVNRVLRAVASGKKLNFNFGG